MILIKRHKIFTAFMAVLILAFAALAWGQQMGYFNFNGASFSIRSGGTQTIDSGGIVNWTSGSYLKIAGTQVTSSATELNTLASVTAGTASASKGVVLSALKTLDSLYVTAVNGTGLSLRPAFRSDIADSALTITVTAGVPAINFYGSDDDTWSVTMNTSDMGLFSGAAGGYAFDTTITGLQPVHNITAAADTFYSTTTPYKAAATPCISGTMFIALPIAQKSTLFLQGAVAGAWLDVMVSDSDTLRIVAASGDSLITSAGAADRSISSVAGTVRLIAVDGVRWIMQYTLGTWTQNHGVL